MNALLRRAGLRGNLAFAFAAQGATALVNIFLSLVVARRLPVEDFSHWQLFTFYSSFVGLTSLGLGQGVYLRCAGHSWDGQNYPLLGGQLRLLALHSLACAGALALLAPALAHTPDRRTVLWAVALYLVTEGCTGFLGCLFQAAGHTRLYSASILLARLLFLCLAARLLATGAQSYRPFLGAWLSAQAGYLLFCLLSARRVLGARGASLPAVLAEVGRNCKAGMPLLLATFLGNLLPGSGKLVVDRAFGLLAFGQFSFALALVSLAGQFAGQVSLVLFPALKREDANGLAKAWRGMDLALDLLLPLPLLAYAPLRALLALWLPPYTQSLAWLGLLLPLFLFDGRTGILYATWLKIHRKEKTLLALNAAGVSAALVLGLLAARTLGGVEGVAIALVAASALRSFLACRAASPLAGQTAKTFPAHLPLAVVFMAGAWFWPALPGFLLYLSACLVFWLANRQKWRDLAVLWGQRAWTS